MRSAVVVPERLVELARLQQSLPKSSGYPSPQGRNRFPAFGADDSRPTKKQSGDVMPAECRAAFR